MADGLAHCVEKVGDTLQSFIQCLPNIILPYLFCYFCSPVFKKTYDEEEIGAAERIVSYENDYRPIPQWICNC